MDDRGRDGPVLSAPEQRSGSPAALVDQPTGIGGRRPASPAGGRWLAPVVGAIMLVALLAVAWPPGGLALDVGQPGDRLFLSGVHGDERAAGRSYRWTRGTATLTVPGLGGAERLRLTLLAEAGRPDGQPVAATVTVDGVPAGALTIGSTAAVTLDVERPAPTRDQAVISITTPTFRPPGDGRDLGVILDAIVVAPLAIDPTPVAALDRWLRLAALAALAVATLLPLCRWWPLPIVLALAGVPVVVAAALARPWLLAAWPWLMAALAGAAIVANWAAVALAARAVGRMLDRRWTGLLALGLLVAAYAVVMTTLAGQIEWIGHADYADNAVVARNLIAGRGYTVDYAAQFYGDYGPAISHPSDVWPLLQPTLIAAAFAVFGPTTFAAKLPNIVAMVLLLAATALIGRWLFGWPAGLGAAALLALDGWFFQNTLFPVNDVPFTLLALVLVALTSLAGRGNGEPAGAAWPWLTRPAVLYPALGVSAGLIVLAKPSGLLLVAGLAGWLGWQARRQPGVWPGWRWPAMAALLAALVVLPLVARNLVTFGQPFYSLQSYDAWVIKWEPPDENIYRLMATDLPHPRRLVGLGLDRVVEAVAVQVRRLWTDLAGGNLIETPLLVLAAIGVLLGGPAVRRTTGALLAAAVPTLLFILVYWHYEERYVVWLVPWLTLLAAGGVIGLARWATSGSDAGRRRLAVGLLAVGIVLVAAPRADALVTQTARLTPPAGDVIVGAWLAANTPPDAVVMTRVPWQTTWHSGRRTVMIPLAPADGIAATIRQYGVDYLVINRLEAASRRREALAPLYDGRETLGFTRVLDFTNPQGQPYATIYRVPPAMRGSAG